jgi:hypothetical protein
VSGALIVFAKAPVAGLAQTCLRLAARERAHGAALRRSAMRAR